MRGFCTLSVLALVAATGSAQVIYSSDFEGDNGGWSGDNDWEWGSPVGFAGSNSSLEPIGGHSGNNAWGTVIGGDHSPSTVSSLTQTFDVTGYTGLSMTFWEWSDSGGNTFDMAAVLVNGNQEYLSNGNSNDAWREVVLDLSAYDGATSLDVNFQFSTTSVVERTGWYLDDVQLSGVPTPGAAALLGLGGLAAARRRR